MEAWASVARSLPMLREGQTKAVGAIFEDRKAESAYTAPEVFPVGLAKNLIQGQAMEPYWDCIRSGKTLIQPNC